jgi:hypothetical protein
MQRTFFRRWLALVALVLMAGVSGCRRDKASAGISDSTFVATIAQLHAVNADTSLDSTGRAAARQAVLREQGVTGEALERAARAMAADPEHALVVWTAIEQRVREAPSKPTGKDSSAAR